MMERDSGHIVAISSCAGKSGAGGLADYCASKFAAYGFNESLRIEMKIQNKNIPVTTICPWFINTGMFQGVNCGILSGLLEQNTVADRIVNAILQEEEEVVIPWRFTFLIHACRLFLTAGMQDSVQWIAGNWKFMDMFRGRGKGDNTALMKTQVK